MPVPALAAGVLHPIIGGVRQDRPGYAAEVHRFAEANGIPVRHFAKGENKEQVARSYIEAVASTGKGKVALIGTAQEKALVWPLWKGRGQEHAAHPHMEWGRQVAFVDHFYFYPVGRGVGAAFWKTNAYAPVSDLA